MGTVHLVFYTQCQAMGEKIPRACKFKMGISFFDVMTSFTAYAHACISHTCTCSLDLVIMAYNESCSYLSEKQANAILVTKLNILSFSFLINIAAIVVLVFFKSYKRFVFRLVLCLLIACLLDVVIQILETTPLDHTNSSVPVRDGWEPACAAFGFLDQVTTWMSNFVIIWILLFLLKIMFQPPERINLFTSPVSVGEAVAICCCFLVPFTFNWIPFTSNYFGASGHWCWIKLSKTEDYCDYHQIVPGVVFRFLFYYAPLMVIMLGGSIVSVVAVFIWFRNITKSDPIKGMIVIVVYPICFIVVCSIITANRIEELRRVKAGQKPLFGLWMAHALADPARTFLPAMFFLLQFCFPTMRKMVMETRRCEEKGYQKLDPPSP